ncbi:restriction endonuclease [Acidithiobacillus ferriphilus]|uniref:restriction endonuclease n=1 Tax=Acidithiobacillus ferriphilus TaxID=1689834 RepID=UPI001C070808|nr:restriction endonuclease [Acidithiobacillus ferriphilus]MBU2846014.1 restriction endonuclease [Acidithiobacillus ferriphilus]
MAENPNTEYERLAQEIYQALADSEANNIDVQHNVLVKGKSGCEHQIDVYWEFTSMGETHKMAIECKNYNQSVSIGRIRDFHAALLDVGNIKGIVVTKRGFQSGAIKYADYYGISLKECRFPMAGDWEGRVKDIIITIHAFMPNVTERELLIDTAWVIENTTLREGDSLLLSGYSNEISIIDDNGSEITNFYEMESRLPQNWKEEVDLEHVYKFDDAYIVTPKYGRLKVLGVKYMYDVRSASSETFLEGEEIARAILKDVQSGRIHFYDRDGNIAEKRDG